MEVRRDCVCQEVLGSLKDNNDLFLLDASLFLASVLKGGIYYDFQLDGICVFFGILLHFSVLSRYWQRLIIESTQGDQ